jgi:hypothetical protein
MPIVSQAQRRAMYSAAAGHSKIGIPKSVGAEFVSTDRPGKLPEYVGHAVGGVAIDPIMAATHVSRTPLQFGGGTAAPWFERAEARDIDKPYGFSLGTGGGRTDKNAVDVGAGSYVLPADVVSGLGEGNSLNGAAVWDRIIRSLPYGIKPSQHRGGSSMPHPPAPFREEGAGRSAILPEIARGGTAPAGKEPDGKVPIASADGEIIIKPEHVMAIGWKYFPETKAHNSKNILAHGHEILDHFVKHVRGRTIEQLETLPGPKGSRNASNGHMGKS